MLTTSTATVPNTTAPFLQILLPNLAHRPSDHIPVLARRDKILQMLQDPHLIPSNPGPGPPQSTQVTRPQPHDQLDQRVEVPVLPAFLCNPDKLLNDPHTVLEPLGADHLRRHPHAEHITPLVAGIHTTPHRLLLEQVATDRRLRLAPATAPGLGELDLEQLFPLDLLQEVLLEQAELLSNHLGAVKEDEGLIGRVDRGGERRLAGGARRSLSLPRTKDTAVDRRRGWDRKLRQRRDRWLRVAGVLDGRDFLGGGRDKCAR